MNVIASRTRGRSSAILVCTILFGLFLFGSPAIAKTFGESPQTSGTEQVHEGRARLWHFAVRFGSIYTVPYNYYYQGLSSDFGFEGSVILPVSRLVSLRATVGRAGAKQGNPSPYPGLEFHANRYLMAVQVNPAFGSGGPKSGLWYLYTGVGAITHYVSTSYRSVSETKLLTEIGCGGVKFIKGGLGVDFGGSFGLFWIEDREGRNFLTRLQSGVLFDFKLGLSYWFARG